MHDFVAIVTKVRLVVQTIPLGVLVAAPCAHVNFTVGTIGVDCDLCLDFV